MLKTIPSVLVVAPDNEVSRNITHKLIDHGFICQLESDFDLALQDIRDKSWSLVVIDLDQEFSRGDGFELAREIRRLRHSQLEIAFVSQNPKVNLYEAHQAGACSVLKKPLRIEDVLDLLKAHGIDMSGPTPGFQKRFNPEASQARIRKISSGGKKKMSTQISLSNIGRGGFFLPIPTGTKIPEIGQLVEFEVKMGMVPATTIKGFGLVAWIHNENGEVGAGIEFVSLPDEAESFVSAFSDLFKVYAFVPKAA